METDKKVFDGNGREMVHPDIVKDMVNDSMTGAIQYMNYKMDYEEARKAQAV